MGEVKLEIFVRRSQKLESLLNELNRLLELFPDEVPSIRNQFVEPDGLLIFRTHSIGFWGVVLVIFPSPWFEQFVSALKVREAAL